MCFIVVDCDVICRRPPEARPQDKTSRHPEDTLDTPTDLSILPRALLTSHFSMLDSDWSRTTDSDWCSSRNKDFSQLCKVRGRGLTHLVARVKDPLSSGGSTVCYLTLVLKAWGLLGASSQDPLLGPPSIAGFCSPPLPKPVLLPNQLPSTSQGRDELNRAEQEVTFTAQLKIKDEFSSQTKHRLVHTSGTQPPGGHLATAGQWEACVLEQVGSTAEGSSGITLWMQTPQRPDVCMAEEEEEQEEEEEEEQEVQEVLYMHSNVAVLV
ncbi:unnamed protein product [Gadus morhua 'NCC']